MNISFLNPSLLWFLPLALGPLIIHLFFGKKPKNTEFSDLRFIRLAAEKVKTRVKLRRYLLLAARTLIMLLLAAAFAKPYLSSRTNAAGSARN